MIPNKTLTELFGQARSQSQVVPLSEIKSLVESGKTSPLAAKRSFQPRRIKRLFNPLKILIMITPIIIITSMLLIWNPGDRRDAYLRPSHPNEKFPPAKAVVTLSRDTVFNGEILQLSKEELTRLGFLFDDEGFYYLNRLPNGDFISLWSWKSGTHSSSGFEESESIHRLNKQQASTFDFYPIISTDPAGQNLHMINLSRTFTVDSFNIMNDTLVPVLFKASTFGGTFSDDLLIWFKPSDSFFNLIGNNKGEPVRNRILLAKELALSSLTQKDRVNYDFKAEPVSLPVQVDSLTTVKLSAEVFRCMGITVAPESIEVIFQDKGIPYKWSVNKYGVGVARLTPDTPNQFTLKASDSVQTDTPYIYAIGTGLINRVTSYPVGFSIASADLLVPVQIADSYLAPFIRKLIFWIYPNERFFKCLPPDIARPMRMEFNYQKKRMDPDFVPRMGGSIGIGGGAPSREPYNLGHPIGIPDKGLKKDSEDMEGEPIPCVYFTNLCESLPGLDYVNLYPNPATDKLNVDLVLQKAKKIRFRIFDLGGREISDAGTPENYTEGGQFRHQLDVSKLQNGFYLLVMTDEEGAKVTRRFVKN